MIRRLNDPVATPAQLHVACRLTAVGRIAPDLETSARGAERLLQTWTEGSLADAPLTWVATPARDLARGQNPLQSLITEIRGRLRRRSDAVVATGYADAAHLLLTPAELARELRWSRRNPWQTGVENVFGTVADACMPSLPLLDAELYGALRRARFRWLGLDGGPPLEPGSERLRLEAGLSSFVCHRAGPLIATARRFDRHAPTSDRSEEIAAELAAVAHRGTAGRTMLILHAPALAGPEVGGFDLLATLVAALERLVDRGWRLTTLAAAVPDPDRVGNGPAGSVTRDSAENAAPAAPTALGGPQPIAPGVGGDPTSTAHWRAAARLRPARQTVAARELLTQLSPTAWHAPAAVDEAAPAPTERTLTASMSGHADLVEPELQAEFLGGRLAGLAFAGAAGMRQAPATPSRSFVITAEDPKRGGRAAPTAWPFVPISSFAFDGGLREILALDAQASHGGVMSLTVDYSVLDAALLIEVLLSCAAEPAGLKQVVPLELSLAPIANAATVDTRSWFGSDPRQARHATLGSWLDVAGNHVEIRADGDPLLHLATPGGAKSRGAVTPLVAKLSTLASDAAGGRGPNAERTRRRGV